MWSKICEVMNFFWGTPLMIFMVGIGLYLTFRTGFFQIRGIGIWFKEELPSKVSLYSPPVQILLSSFFPFFL